MDILIAQTNSNTGSGIAAFLPIIMIGLIFYFLILRPQTRQKKKHEDIINNLKKGDKIITRGGIYGKIVNIKGKKENIVTIDVGSNLNINIERSYISGLAQKLEDTNKGK